MKFWSGIAIVLVILLYGCRGEPQQQANDVVEAASEPDTANSILEEVVSDARIASKLSLIHI